MYGGDGVARAVPGCAARGGGRPPSQRDDRPRRDPAYMACSDFASGASRRLPAVVVAARLFREHLVGPAGQRDLLLGHHRDAADEDEPARALRFGGDRRRMSTWEETVADVIQQGPAPVLRPYTRRYRCVCFLD